MKGKLVQKAAVSMALVITASTAMTPALSAQAQEVIVETENEAAETEAASMAAEPTTVADAEKPTDAADTEVKVVGVEISEANFPDATFRQYVSDKIDKDKDGMLSDDEIAAVTVIDIATGQNWMYKKAQNLKGIEYFTGLITLRCNGSDVTALDLSKNTALSYLKCNETPLTALDLSYNTALKELNCHDTAITSLNLSNNTALEKVWCQDAPVTSIDVSGCPKLKFLNVENTRLTYLDVSRNTVLTSLYVEGTPLYAINTGNNENLPDITLSQEMNITVPADSFDITEYMPSVDVTKLTVSGAQLDGATVSGYTAETPVVCTYKDGSVTITVTLHLTVEQAEQALEIS